MPGLPAAGAARCPLAFAVGGVRGVSLPLSRPLLRDPPGIAVANARPAVCTDIGGAPASRPRRSRQGVALDAPRWLHRHVPFELPPAGAHVLPHPPAILLAGLGRSLRLPLPDPSPTARAQVRGATAVRARGRRQRATLTAWCERLLQGLRLSCSPLSASAPGRETPAPHRGGRFKPAGRRLLAKARCALPGASVHHVPSASATIALLSPSWCPGGCSRLPLSSPL